MWRPLSFLQRGAPRAGPIFIHAFVGHEPAFLRIANRGLRTLLFGAHGCMFAIGVRMSDRSRAA